MKKRFQEKTDIEKYLYYFDGNMKDLVVDFANSSISLDSIFIIFINNKAKYYFRLDPFEKRRS